MNRRAHAARVTGLGCALMTAVLICAGLTAPRAWAVATRTSVAAADGASVQADLPGGGATVVQRRLVGRSVQGRPIMAYRLGDPTSTVKAMLIGQMHGDEHAGVISAMAMVTGRPLAGVDLWVIPTMNPDGDAANTRVNAHGVDLNRNWPDYWAPLTGQFYSGPAPLSEPESRAMTTFLKQVAPHYLIVIHQPLDGVDTTDGGARDPGFSRRLAVNLGLAQKAFRCFSFCHGSMTGWLTDHGPTVAITVEFGWSASRPYLAGAVPAALLRSIPGARYATAADRNPVSAIAAITIHGDPGTGAALGHAGSTVTITGSSWDPDARARPIAAVVSDGGTVVWRGTTTAGSVPLDRRQLLTGPHGFTATFAAAPGRHRYCLTGTNVGTGTRHPASRCRTVTVDGRPFGHLDTAVGNSDGTLTLTGWAINPNRAATGVTVRAVVSATTIGRTTTTLPRPDIVARYHVAGAHGFAVTVPAAAQPPADPARYCVVILSDRKTVPDIELNCISPLAPS